MKNRLNAFYLPEETQVSECLLQIWKEREKWPVQAAKSLDSLIVEVQEYQEGFMRGSRA